MMTKHLDFIDSLKGFTIFLVVFAHVIAWSYIDYETILTDVKVSWLFQLIYAFHMPLFFFLSGYLAFHSFERSKPFNVVKRRTLQLLVPYIFAEIFVTCVLQQKMNYWFLIALYMMYIVTALGEKWKYLHPLLTWVIIYGTTIIFPCLNNIDYLFIPSFKMHYVSFLLGFYFCKYPRFLAFARKRIYPIALMGFSLLFVFPLMFNGINMGGQGKIELVYKFVRSSLACFYLFFLFEQYHDSVPYKSWFERIGKDTLIIYIVHVFFKFTIPKCGEFIKIIPYPTLLQICYALLLSILLISIALVFKKIIFGDKCLSKLIMGK